MAQHGLKACCKTCFHGLLHLSLSQYHGKLGPGASDNKSF